MELSTELEIYYRLGVALAIGLLMGIERGWKDREAQEGGRVAGVRTYGLFGLLGGATALVAEQISTLLMGFAFLALAALMTTAYVINYGRYKDASITGIVAGLLAFAFGAMAVLGEEIPAAAFAVVTTVLLSLKPILHRWIHALEVGELRAGMRLLLISVVLLPILPNHGYGPWQALNPYAIWWMVVLIAAISFAGYFAIKAAGARKGAMYTGLFAGLASSTALTLHFSRIGRNSPALAPLLATGILMACGTMYPRMYLIACLVNPLLWQPLLLPAVVMSLTVYAIALFFYWRSQSDGEAKTVAAPVQNPLELMPAVSFGVLLAVIMLFGEALRRWVGDTGVLALAGVSGIADVDAITLSLSRMSTGDLTASIAATGVIIAAAVNSVVKGFLAASVGGRALGLRVGLPLLAAAAGGLLSAGLFFRQGW
jgi:uncharacterized membrane protein (DUF4010 family)